MNNLCDERAGQLEVEEGDLVHDGDEVLRGDVLVVGEDTVDDSLLVGEGGSKARGDELLPGLLFLFIQPCKGQLSPKESQNGA